MRVGDKVFPQTSRDWKPPSEWWDRGTTGQAEKFLLRASVLLSEALEALRHARRLDAADRGKLRGRILETEDETRSALAGSMAMLLKKGTK